MPNSLTLRLDRHVINLLGNSALDFWQRNTAFTSVADATVTADRFRFLKNGTMVYDVNRDAADVPTFAQAGFQFNYSMRINITTAQASLSAANRVAFYQALEGQDYMLLHGGKSCRLQFWVKMSLAGTYSAGLQNSAQTRSYAKTFTISASEANTWVKKTVDIVTDNTGTWLFDNNVGLYAYVCLAAGTSYQVTADGVWETTTAPGKIASASTTNFASSTSNVCRMTGFMLVEGDYTSGNVDFDFRRAGRNIGDELMKCQRYTHRPSFDTQVSGSGGAVYGSGGFVSASLAVFFVPFPVNMRAIPTFSYSGASSGVNVFSSSGGTASQAAVTGTPNYNFSSSAAVYLACSAGGTAGFQACLVNNSTTTAYIQFDAEL